MRRSPVAFAIKRHEYVPSSFCDQCSHVPGALFSNKPRGQGVCLQHSPQRMQSFLGAVVGCIVVNPPDASSVVGTLRRAEFAGGVYTRPSGFGCFVIGAVAGQALAVYRCARWAGDTAAYDVDCPLARSGVIAVSAACVAFGAAAIQHVGAAGRDEAGI